MKELFRCDDCDLLFEKIGLGAVLRSSHQMMGVDTIERYCKGCWKKLEKSVKIGS